MHRPVPITDLAGGRVRQHVRRFLRAPRLRHGTVLSVEYPEPYAVVRFDDGDVEHFPISAFEWTPTDQQKNGHAHR